jgi:hypothetical protein
MLHSARSPLCSAWESARSPFAGLGKRCVSVTKKRALPRSMKTPCGIPLLALARSRKGENADLARGTGELPA